MKQLVDGLNDCTNSEYHNDKKYVSSSVLKTVLKSLDKYYDEYVLGNKPEFSQTTLAAFSEGSLTHAHILEPHTVANDFAFFKGFRKAGPEYEAFLAAQRKGVPVISSPQKHRVDQLIAAYKARPEAVELIKNGFAEQTICGNLFGVDVKVRFDYINVEAGYIADVKTTGYGSDLESFKLTVNDFSYQLSAALYCAMAEQYYGKPFKFYFIVLSKKTFTCDVYVASKKTMNDGKRMVQEACLKLKNARENNCWTEITERDKLALVTDYEIQEL